MVRSTGVFEVVSIATPGNTLFTLSRHSNPHASGTLIHTAKHTGPCHSGTHEPGGVHHFPSHRTRGLNDTQAPHSFLFRYFPGHSKYLYPRTHRVVWPPERSHLIHTPPPPNEHLDVHNTDRLHNTWGCVKDAPRQQHSEFQKYKTKIRLRYAEDTVTPLFGFLGETWSLPIQK